MACPLPTATRKTFRDSSVRAIAIRSGFQPPLYSLARVYEYSTGRVMSPAQADLPSRAPGPGTTPPRAYFLLDRPRDERDPLSPARYFHVAISIAEGLCCLGWQIGAEVPVWKANETADWLFRPAPSGMDGSDLIVVSNYWWRTAGEEERQRLMAFRGKVPIVCLVQGDFRRGGLISSRDEALAFDAVFRTHMNRRFKSAPNVHPQPFGLTERLVNLNPRFESKERGGVVWRFTMKQPPHTSRVAANRTVRDELSQRTRLRTEESEAESTTSDDLLYRQTHCRHRPSFYKTVAASAAVACYGGWLLPAWQLPESGLMHRLANRLPGPIQRRFTALGQWDSFRLWETFSLGACAILPDLDRYGCELPVAPVAGEHYLDIDPARPTKQQLDAIRDTERLVEIGARGRQWAMEHYSPLAIAQRLLTRLGMPVSRTTHAMP